MDRYSITKTIGKGTYGSVVSAIDLKTNEKVAIKKMKKKFYDWKDCISLPEVKCLKTLNHHNIVKVIEVFTENNQLYIVFEFMQLNVYELTKKR